MIVRVNTQINKHFNLNEYFIAIGLNIQCLDTIMALGHIYTNILPLALMPFTTISKTHLLKMVV